MTTISFDSHCNHKRFVMELSRISLVCLVWVVAVGVARSNKDNFFQYGAERDLVMKIRHSYYVLQLVGDTRFPFYGHKHGILYVHSDGAISFNDSFAELPTQPTNNHFPLVTGPDYEASTDVLIAPFWADVDISDERGEVYHRQSQSSEDLESATTRVRGAFPQYTSFEAQWVLVVTWNNVSFFNHSISSSSDPRNTFQAALTTDGQHSFAFFLYDEITWTAGTVLGGDSDTGIPPDEEHQAIVGFNKGDGETAYTDGFPADEILLPEYSNVDQPGTYIFQVDGGNIVPASCLQNGSCHFRDTTSMAPAVTGDISPSPSPTPEPSGIPVWVIVVIVLIFAASGLGLLALYICKKRKRDEKSKPPNAEYSVVRTQSKVYDDTTEDM